MTSWIEAWAQKRIAEVPNLTVKRMAEELRVPLGDLYRLNPGRLTPKKYLIQLRLARVKRGLTRDRRRVREVAAECGFRDVCYFSKWFKGLVGMSPKRYQVWARWNREASEDNQV